MKSAATQVTNSMMWKVLVEEFRLPIPMALALLDGGCFPRSGARFAVGKLFLSFDRRTASSDLVYDMTHQIG